MTNMSPAGLPDGLPDAQDEPEPDSPSKERRLPPATSALTFNATTPAGSPILFG